MPLGSERSGACRVVHAFSLFGRFAEHVSNRYQILTPCFSQLIIACKASNRQLRANIPSGVSGEAGKQVSCLESTVSAMLAAVLCLEVGTQSDSPTG